ncbi:FAD-dependent oxidoreductase [Candidatus Sumerlaeota bacterium]|nr:FAD-dependent oxidoreductase [Candidatus Sumerlaeota bacterium]
MRIAIVGSGISGLVAAHLLHGDHEITVFEAGEHIGGHTNTIPVEWEGETHAIDTGFIVHNERTYPNFTELLRRLGVETQPSEMSFSVRCEETGLEYAGTSLNTLFAQRRNLLRPSFHRMIRDILRFYRESRELLHAESNGLTLGQYLERGRYSRTFIDQHLIPMGSAVWSAGVGSMLDFPAQMFVRFFENHGFLDLRNRPQWRVIRGGSWRYVEKMVMPFRDRVRLRCPVRSVVRRPDGIEITSGGQGIERFDEVILACHSDQALALLADATPQEREILGAMPYEENEAILHTDTSLMPRSRRAWAAWNSHRLREDPGRVAITYNMNILQGLSTPTQFMVTLNRREAIDPAKIIRVITYHHPVYTVETLRAQGRHGEISGVNRTHLCGANWGNGFHEDGVNSALRVCEALGARL